MLAFAGEGAEVAFHLGAVPEGVGLAEEDAETDGHGRSDGPLASHDLVDRPRRHVDRAGHGVLRDALGLEQFLQQDFAGGDGGLHGGVVASDMIVFCDSNLLLLGAEALECTVFRGSGENICEASQCSPMLSRRSLHRQRRRARR